MEAPGRVKERAELAPGLGVPHEEIIALDQDDLLAVCVYVCMSSVPRPMPHEAVCVYVCMCVCVVCHNRCRMRRCVCMCVCVHV